MHLTTDGVIFLFLSWAMCIHPLPFCYDEFPLYLIIVIFFWFDIPQALPTKSISSFSECWCYDEHFSPFKEYFRINPSRDFLWCVNLLFLHMPVSQSNLNQLLSKGFSFSTLLNYYSPIFCFPGQHLSLSCSSPHSEVYKCHRPLTFLH